MLKKRKSAEGLVLFLILLTAFVFRFQHIQSTPPGLYPDEAMNGNDAIQALETGNYKLFYPDNNGREGLFINIQAQALKIFGPPYQPWMLRAVSAVFGLLTVLALYLLTRRLYNWQIASIAGFYLAISLWHVNFSRIGFRAIMAPMLATFAFYFLWKGIEKAKVWPFAVSGIFLGLGFHTYIGFRIIPIVAIILLASYWIKIKKDYSHEKYAHLRNDLIRGFAALLVFSILASAPILYYFWLHPEDFIGRAGQVVVTNAGEPLKELADSTIKTLGMFNFMGDWNWRHNLAGRPQLYWPIGILFLIGILRTFRKLFKDKKQHGHYKTLDVFLLSWFFLALLPSILSSEGLPHALRSIGAIPPTMIFAALATWWVFERLGAVYRIRDIHPESQKQKYFESKAVAGIVMIIFLIAMALAEYYAYFRIWARNPNTAGAFSQNYSQIGEQINKLPIETKKYVVVKAGGVLVNGIPMPAQTVMFITDTATTEKQKQKNVFYVLDENQIRDRKSVVFVLE